MGTVVSATAPRHYIERRRERSAPPRGKGFVERRRPVFVIDVEDLHDGDVHDVLADRLDYGVGSDSAGRTAALLAGLIVSSAPVALTAHDLGR
jgi:hypothetical protein